MQSEEMRDGVTNRATDIKRGKPAGMRHANGLIRILIAIVVRERELSVCKASVCLFFLIASSISSIKLREIF